MTQHTLTSYPRQTSSFLFKKRLFDRVRTNQFQLSVAGISSKQAGSNSVLNNFIRV